MKNGSKELKDRIYDHDKKTSLFFTIHLHFKRIFLYVGPLLTYHFLDHDKRWAKSSMHEETLEKPDVHK